MKTKLIYFAVILLTLQANAQETETYKSFLHSGVTKWLYFIPSDACGLYEISAYGDTIINEYKYKKLWNSSNYLFYPEAVEGINQQWLVSNDLSNSFSLNLFIRQSTDSSKLYLFDARNNEEYLIVDISLNIGDEFYFPGIGTEIVESVIYENGLKTIHFKENNSLYVQKLVFLEGIGSNIDFTDANGYYSLLNSSLVCYSRSEFLYNSPPEICGCVATKTPETGVRQLHYKLVDNNIEIQLNELSSGSCEMLEFSGKVVRRSELTNESVLRISTTGLNRGLYLIRLYDTEKGENFTLKVLL